MSTFNFNMALTTASDWVNSIGFAFVAYLFLGNRFPFVITRQALHAC